MDINRSEVINRLNALANKLTEQAQDVFHLFDYEVKVALTGHFIDRLMQRYPTYEVAEGIIEPMLEDFIARKADLICKSFSGKVEYRLVNIRHPQLFRQNTLVLQITYSENVIKLQSITIFKSTTTSITSAPENFVLLHKKPKFFVVGQVGKRLLKYAENNEVPVELKSITQLWK